MAQIQPTVASCFGEFVRNAVFAYVTSIEQNLDRENPDLAFALLNIELAARDLATLVGW